MVEETLLYCPDTTHLETLLKDTKTNVEIFNKAYSNIAKEYSKSLDNLMSDLYVECILNGNADIETLNRYYLELSNMVYFMLDKVEDLSVHSDMAGAAAKEVYSHHYLAGQVKDVDTGKNKTTVAELQAKAELGSQYETVVATIYDHAYKVVKGKISSAQDMMNTLRKILSVKTAELQLSTYGPQQNKTGFVEND